MLKAYAGMRSKAIGEQKSCVKDRAQVLQLEGDCSEVVEVWRMQEDCDNAELSNGVISE